ncbi:helix-turn-helix protein [mine drainage metagenome]|uniref:Helix-turn-helix protein n=1 Tax=mine drainage metagenome TaxID=410659 RepID=A0A1J5RSZ3_9ZZZZ
MGELRGYNPTQACGNGVGRRLKRSVRYTSEESADWLYARMGELGIGTLDELAELTGIDKGTLSRYFRQERRPSIDVIGPLCTALEVSVETLLRALGALDRKRS